MSEPHPDQRPRLGHPGEESEIRRVERRRTRAGLTVVITMLVVTMVLAGLLVLWTSWDQL